MAGLSQASLFHRLLGIVLDLIFPSQCAGCGKPGDLWCPDCQRGVQTIGGQVCQSCGLPLLRGNLCSACTLVPPRFMALRSWALYEDPLRKALIGLKFKNCMPVGEALARQAASFLEGQKWPIELVVPIPLSEKRLRERGYNQVGLIAHPLAIALGFNYAPKALTRCRDTHSQVGLSGEQRRENVRDVFRADGARVRGRTVLLIDDIATTGATLTSATDALLSGGAYQVYGFTIARALHWQGDALI